MYKSPPSTPRGRPRTPPENNWNHSSRQQKSRLDAALTAQWSKYQDQERSVSSKDGRKTNVDRRDRENIISSGESPPSKFQKPNEYEAELQNVRARLKPTSSTESSPTNTGNVPPIYRHGPGTSAERPMDTSQDSLPSPADKEVTISTKLQGQDFGKISAITVSKALRSLVSAYTFRVLSTNTIKVTINASFLPKLLGITSFCGKEVEVAVI